LRIYLPPCYHPDAPSPYPLLILLHGQGSQADQWERLGVTAAADHLIPQGVISAPVIVMPQEDDTYSNPFESGYDRALVDDLLPWMEENYAVCASRECRAIGGISRGAAWAMYIALNRPGQFGAVGAHSFPSFYGDETRLPLLLRDIPPGQLPRIWMDTGSRDRYLSQARRYHELLDQYHVPHEWHVYEGEHDEAYWSAHLEDYLKWYLAEKLVPKT
jgi:enterochelin esterase-like enzyme